MLTDSFFTSLSNLKWQIQLLSGSTDCLSRGTKDTSVIDIEEVKVAFEEVERQAEEFISARQLMDNFFENAAVPLHWVGPDGQILKANQAELDLLGYSREEYLEHHIADFHVDSHAIEDIMRRLSSGKSIQDYPARLRAKDGSIKHVLISSNVFREDGRFVHTWCFTRDVTAQESAEETLRQSQAFWERLLSILPVGVYSTNQEGVITSFNQCAVELWGRTPKLNDIDDRFCGSLKLYDLQGNPVPHSECPMGQTLRDGMPRRNLEMVIERPDGSRGVALVNPSPILDEGGKLIGAVNCFMDITDRKQAEEQINQRARQQEVVAQIGQKALKGATLEALFDEAAEKVALALDVEYCKVLQLLPDGQRLLLLAGVGWKEGYVGEATVGVDKDSQAGFTLLYDSPVILEDLRTETRFSGPPLLHDHGVVSGMSVVISLRNQPFGVLAAHTTRHRRFTGDDANFLQAVANILADAIERKLAEDRLSEERHRLEVLVETAPVGVSLIDAEGNIVLMNQELERIIGLKREGLVGGKWYEEKTVKLLPDGEPYELEETPAYRSLHYGKTVRAEEVQFQSADGPPRFTLINSAPVVSPDKRITGAIRIVQDITPLEELESRRSEFLGMVSHELRNPLNNIKLSAFFGLDSRATQDPEEASELFGVIHEEANRMQEIIDNLLDVNRIEFGLIPLHLECHPLEDLLEAAKEVFSRSGRSNPLVVNLPEDLPQARVDRARTIQVLENLLDNAYKYSPASCPIFISAEFQFPYITIHVTDQGKGIPSDKLSLLFKKFARLDVASGKGKPGVGLGLAICKGIVEAHGGRIWADSAGEGQGATFSFTLPAHQARPQPSDPQDNQTGDMDGSRKGSTILVVDDEAHTVRVLRRLLAQAGYWPVTTTDPFQVTQLVNSESPDLVLLDLRLPGISGFDLFREIRVHSNAPIMLLTGSDSREDIQEAVELKAADYITKPYSPTELLARIETALEGQESQH